jgi:hypothetical protein
MGAALVALTAFLAWHFHPAENAAELLALKARKLDLVEGMSLDLASASDAEKGAVMAATEQDSQLYADQAVAALELAGARRRELADLLAPGKDAKERALLDELSTLLEAFRGLDRELMSLAVRHTNAKATALAFGPAAQAIDDLRAALARVAQRDAGATPFACGAQAAALHLQTLLAPHIAEPSDERMDALEARMEEDDREVRGNLERLAGLEGLATDPDLQAAASAYERFAGLRADILRLSRENTNVLSIALALDQRRRAAVLCGDALEALKAAIQAEEIPGVAYGPVNPRRLGGEPAPAR